MITMRTSKEETVSYMYVRVESWFTAGVVVSYTDQYGVEYRGALLKSTDETPEFKASFRELASLVSVLHDHPYSELMKKAWKKQVLSQVQYSPYPPAAERAVSRRNGYLGKIDRRRAAIVETDFIGDSITQDFGDYSSKCGRSAKYHAKLKLNDYSNRLRYGLVNKRRNQPQNRKPVKQKKPKAREKVMVPELSPRSSSPSTHTPLSSPLGSQELSPSLLAHAQNCTVGLTPTSTLGFCSPLRFNSRTDFSDNLSNSAGPSSRGSSVSPIQQATRPFSILVQKVPMIRVPNTGTAVIAVE